MKTCMFVALGHLISLCYSRCSTIEKPQKNVISAEQTPKFLQYAILFKLKQLI